MQENMVSCFGGDLMDVKEHYDLLIDEENDPFRDPEELRQYMDKWDGEPFLAAMELKGEEKVLEIGVGTGRLAGRVLPRCGTFTGIDLSEKTVARAKENLAPLGDACLIAGDFLDYPFAERFDLIYASLTTMHFPDKEAFLRRARELLCPGGRLLLSLDKSREIFLDMGTRKLRIYPDDPDTMEKIGTEMGFRLKNRFEVEFADVLLFQKERPAR